MEISFVWLDNEPVPVPLVDGMGLHKELSEYLIARAYRPQFIRRNMKPVGGGTIRQIAYDLKVFLEALSYNNVSVEEADYVNHIQAITEAQLQGAEPKTYNSRLTRIRDFYEFLTKRGIRTKARFPAKTVRRMEGNQDDNFLSHTAFDNSITYEHDEGHKRITSRDDYKDKVISIEKYGDLYRKLKEIDPVYAVISQVMMQSLLRVADVCEMPLHTNKYNKYIPLWPEFERMSESSLKYRGLTKYSKVLKIDLFSETIESMYKDYIEPYYSERKKKYVENYEPRKNSTLDFGNIRNNYRRAVPKDLLWMTASGAPVKPYMIEQAFRDTGLNVVPHMLRHTGATHIIFNYCQLHNIDIDVRMATIFQTILQDQLGHASLETTRMYIRTILKLKATISMPFCIPSNKKELDERLSGVITKDIEQKMLGFFEYAASSVESDSA